MLPNSREFPLTRLSRTPGVLSSLLSTLLTAPSRVALGMGSNHPDAKGNSHYLTYKAEKDYRVEETDRVPVAWKKASKPEVFCKRIDSWNTDRKEHME